MDVSSDKQYYVDPQDKTLDELWLAADAACHWFSPNLAFMGVGVNLAGPGGYLVHTFGWDAYGRPLGDKKIRGTTPRLAIMNLISTLEQEPKPEAPKPWFYPAE